MIMEKKRILFIGAHPDDADILCGGTALKLAKAGHAVKFVSVTNGDTGHHVLSREETARIRKGEALASAKYAGLYEYEVMDNPCGIEASVENRRKILRVIRRFAPDVVISHRTCDYHPDHRATAQLVQDCAYVCMVPHFCEDTPIPEKAPVFALSYDGFQDPRPHRADAAIEFDSILEEKLHMMSNHASQFFEWLPWVAGNKTVCETGMTEEEKRQSMLSVLLRFETAADGARELLKRVHGEEIGTKIRFAETFEQSPYSRVVSVEEFQKLLEP